MDIKRIQKAPFHFEFPQSASPYISRHLPSPKLQVIEECHRFAEALPRLEPCHGAVQGHGRTQLAAGELPVLQTAQNLGIAGACRIPKSKGEKSMEIIMRSKYILWSVLSFLRGLKRRFHPTLRSHSYTTRDRFNPCGLGSSTQNSASVPHLRPKSISGPPPRGL